MEQHVILCGLGRVGWRALEYLQAAQVPVTVIDNRGRSDDLVSLSTALLVRHLHADVRIVVRMFNQNLIARLGSAVRNVHPLSTSALAAPLFALIARTGEALGAFRQE